MAFVFPGQGSQSVGMLADMAARSPIVGDTFATASAALGYDLWTLCQDDPDGRLSKTEVTQPALLTASIALWRVWLDAGGAQPSLLAGHSLGEYSALVAAGALELADAVTLVATRGRYMQEAVPAGSGGIAAVLGLDDDAVIAACESVGDGVVEAVNFNAPGQVVIAGDKAAVEAAIEACKAAGAKRALPLPVSVPSHCALMQPAAARLAETLAGIEISAPGIDIVNNVDVARTRDPAAIRDALVRQLHSPVRWTETMQAFASAGVSQIIECGPGKVLGGLQKRIDRGVATGFLETPAGLDAALEGA
ncbi:MAG: ACP S-malonyltransferase [Pseudomonadota bacterium]